MNRSTLFALALVGLAFLLLPAEAAAQGVAFVKNDAMGVGIQPTGTIKFEVRATSSFAAKLEDTQSGARRVLNIKAASGSPFVRYESAFRSWDFTGGNFFVINDPSDGQIEFKIDAAGNLTLSGNVITTNCPAGCGPDYVFEPDYELMPLEELSTFVTANRHLPNIPSAWEMETEGVNMTQLQLKMLEKIEELTLYTLQQQKEIEALTAKLSSLEAK